MKRRFSEHRGFSLMELLAVVIILGTLAALIVPRITQSSSTAKEKADAMNRAQINSAVELYYLNEGAWPEIDLSDIGADLNYFPDGVPLNPATEGAYALNATTHRVIGSGGGGKASGGGGK